MVKKSTPPVWLLGIASGLSPFGVTMIVPLLAAISAQFQTSFGTVQFVISAYLLGLGLAQPFNGFLCDRFGRRPVMLIGFFIFVIASTAAAFSSSIEALIILRFLQAMGVSVGTVASRAVIRDTRDTLGSVEAMSYIAAITGFAPIFAPVLGGFLGSVGGYSAVFLSTAVIGAGIWVLMYFRLEETLDAQAQTPKWSQWASNYRVLLGSPVFLAYSGIFGFVQGSFFTFLAVGAAVFDAEFGIGQQQFGLIWGLLAVAYVIGAIAGGRATHQRGAEPVMKLAVSVTVLAGWAMTLLVVANGVTLFGLLLPLTILMAAAGGIIPVSLAGAVNAHPQMAGTSSGLSSAIGIVVGGAFTVVAGFMYEGDFVPVVWLIAVSASLTAITWFLIKRFCADRLSI